MCERMQDDQPCSVAHPVRPDQGFGYMQDGSQRDFRSRPKRQNKGVDVDGFAYSKLSKSLRF